MDADPVESNTQSNCSSSVSVTVSSANQISPDLLVGTQWGERDGLVPESDSMADGGGTLLVDGALFFARSRPRHWTEGTVLTAPWMSMLFQSRL